MTEGASVQQATGRVRVTFTQAMALLGPYIKDRLILKAVRRGLVW